MFRNIRRVDNMEQRIAIGLFLVFCAAWQAHAAVNCTTAGRFPEPTDTTCQNYTLCVLDSTTGTFLSYNYTCPTTSVFNPASAQCTAPTNYVCNVTNTSTSTTSVCTADGYIADPSSTNCSSYIECVQVNGTFTETTYPCPPNTFYNPNTTLCESDYNCTTTSTFTCTTPGRFADTTDTSCQNYFFCVNDSTTSTFIQYNYTCPTTSLFSPTLAQCTSTYTCTS